MSTMTIIDNEYATLYYHSDKKIVHHEFHKFIFGQPFRDVLTKGAEIFEKYSACKWLSDDTGNGALTPEDSEWALGEWQPRIMKAGWKYWAVVMPEKVIGQMNMTRWIKTYADSGIVVQVFSNSDEAMKWLEKQ